MATFYRVHPVSKYGQHWHNITTDAEPPTLNDSYNVVEIEGGEFRWVEKNGIYAFGIWRYDPSRRPGHGGLWSSRPSILAALVLHEPVTQVSAFLSGFEMAGYAMKQSDCSPLPPGWTWENGNEKYSVVAVPPKEV